MECVEGLRRPDRGTIAVLGLDPHRATRYGAAGSHRRPAAGGAAAEADQGAGGGGPLGVAVSRRRSTATGCSSSSGLSDKRDAWFMTLSGGQKQRLFIALALINDPEVVFLDELTTGLDPQARRAIWELVRGIRARGKTVFLTTHLMEEAERLCDRVAIIDHGRIIDVGHAGRAGRAATAPSGRSCVATADPAPAMTCCRLSRTWMRWTREDGALHDSRARGTIWSTDVIQCLAEHRIRGHRLPHRRCRRSRTCSCKLTGHSIRD